jgi:polyisoprenoid-binding protein YceI
MKIKILSIVLGISVALVLIIFLKTHTNENTEKTIVPKSASPIENYNVSNLTAGKYIADLESSVLKWEAEKPLLRNYRDSGIVRLSAGQLLVIQNGSSTSATGKFVIDMDSILAEQTGFGGGADKLTAHLKSEDFFNVAQFKTSEIDIVSLKPKEDGKYTVSGNLKIKGISHPITFDINTSTQNNKFVVGGKIEIDRTLWDIRFASGKFFKNLGDKVIKDTFTVDIHIVLSRV